jgi:hypothetical protein
MSDNKRKLYDALSQDYDMGTFEQFSSDIENPEKRRKLYDATIEEYDFGDYDSFSEQLGFGKEQPKPSLEVEQDNVTMEQPVSVAPTIAVPTPKATDEVSEDNTAVNQPISKVETPATPKFGTQFKPLKPEIQTIVNPNITTFADQTPQEYAVGVKEGFKQGSKALGAGLQNIAGEALNVATGSSRDDAGALAKMEQMEVVEKQPLLSKAERKMHAMYADDGGNNRIAMVQGEDGKLRRITDEERQKHKDILLQDEYNKIINEAIDEAGGDVVKAKEILSERAADKTAGDKLIEAAGDKMATIKPTKGFGAWVGNIIPQMIPSTLGMGASLLTKDANVGKLIGGLTIGTMSAATAGQSMKEARDAGATSGQVWLTGLTDGLIEWATEQIPYDRYTKRLFNGTKSKINEALGKELAKEASPLKDELGDILKKANKELNGKLLNGKNVKDYISDIAAEGASEFTAEALQTITPIIYANEEDYPTFKQIMEAGWEGAKAGVFMGAVLGGTRKNLEYAQNRNRRKQQGYVDVAQVQKDGETVIGEVLGLNKENGRIAMLIDGVSEEFEPANITESYRFTFEEFERGNIEKQQDESFEQGYDLVEPQQMNDAQLELEEAENEAIRAFGVNNIEDVDAALNDMPLSSVLSMVDSEEAQQQILNYLNAKARVEGMYQKVRDDIDSAVEESNKLIDSRVNEETHMIQPATLKTEDRQVYVVSGNIKMFDDGSAVDPANSSEHIIVKDAATGKLEMLSPNDVLRADEAIKPSDEKALAAKVISDELATEGANKIDGVVPFNAGDEYVVMFDDGTQHTAKVITDNGDGNVQVQIDNEPQATVASKEQVQQMVNAANKVRVAQNKQAQIEQEQVVEEQAQQEAEKPKYAEKDTITIRLDDGREVRGSISKEADADGNIEVFTEQPIDGDAKVAYFTEEELDGRVVMHNDQAIELPTPEPVTALSQIPMDENSEPLFEQAPASLTYDALVEMNEGDAAEALDTAQQMLAIAKKELKAEEKSTPKVGGNVMEIQKAKAEKKERMKPLQERVAYWESVVNEPTQRKAKKAETASLAEKDEAPKAEEVAEVAPQEVIEEVKQEVVETPVEEPVEETAPVAEEAEAVEQQEVEPTPVVEEVETQEPIEAVKQEVKRTIPVSGVEALWARREEFYDANDPISKELIDRIYEAHPEEHQVGEFEKYNRRLIEAAMKHKGHPVADEILKQVKEENTISYRENKRREPLRERVKQWEDSLGVKATVIESFDDITTEDAKAAITEGYTITGWVEDGKVFLYMPNIANKTEVDKTYLHEVVAHIGLERLMGKQAYNAFCQRVWDEVMTEEQRKEYIDYPNVDSEAMAAHEYMAHLAEDSSLEQTAWQKIVRIFKDALRALGVELRLTNEDIQNALVDSFKNLNEAARSIEAEGGVVDSKRGDVSFAVKDILKGAEQEKAIKDLMRVTGRSRETVVKYIKAEESLARIILDENNVALLDLQVDESVPSIWENSDYPQGTVEFSNICRKRLPFTMIYQQLQKEFPDTVFDATTLETIRGILKENGEDVACGLCFVEDRRQLLGEIGQSFIDAVKGENTDINEKQKEALNTLKESGDNYTPNLYELLTLDGMKKLRREHPEVAVAFIKYNNARGMQAGRLFQAYSAYHRDILKFNKARVDKINNSGGLRIFSYSDFEAHHLIDLVQVLTDCSRKGVKVQGYTKVPEFAKAVKDTKMKLNRSLIAKGKGIVDADYVPQEGEAVSPNVINGKRLLLDTVEGIDVNHPDFFDSSSSANVGNIIVGISDEHIKQAMADPFVDYIIPFHSGIKEETLKQKGIGDWKNYKLEQLEKIANEKGKLVNADKHGVNIYTEVLSDDIKTEKQFVEKYLKVCKAKGWIPKFHRLLDTNKDGDFVYTKGYYKLLLDYKLFNKNGKILPQEVVSPIFDPAYNEKILSDYVEGEKAKAPNQEIYEKIKDTLKEQGKVSFRFIGEKGAANLDNAEEATTRIDNLAIAREMEEADKSPRTIKTATGWERGADGKWRYEVDDEITAKTIRSLKGAGLKKILEARSKRINDLDKFAYITTIVGVDQLYDADKIMATSWPEAQKKTWLDAYNIYKDDRDAAIRDVTQARNILRQLTSFGKGEFFLYEALGNEHPLFKEYPQMRDVKLVIKPYKGSKNMGGYNRLTNTIEIVDFRGIMENDKGEGTANTLTHEIQHVVQGIEGFARGGNVNMVNPNAVKERNEQAAVISDKIEALKAQEEKLWAEREALNKTFEDWYESHPEGEYEEMMRDEQMSEADKRYSEVDDQIKPLQDERIELEQQLNDLMRNTDTSLGIEGYKRLAGEVEARNVERRRNMSLGERRNSPAWLTEDVARKDQIFIEDALDNSSESSESRVSFRKVSDPELLAKLENSETMKVYRAMQVIDGKLYPPMSAKVDGKLREPSELGVWEEAEENPSLADDRGYFKLDKGNKKSLKARYNPYIHTSTTPLNDQFSEAQDRPNLVTVEVEIPVSELTSGYKAEKAKDAVGKLEWKAGVVQGKLSGTRTVILSRWDKPVRIVPDSEVADLIVEMFDGRDITMPSNVVTPSLRAELEKRGVPFVETNNQGKEIVSFRIKPMVQEVLDEYDNSEDIFTIQDVADRIEAVINEYDGAESTLELENILEDFRQAQDDAYRWGYRMDSGGEEVFEDALRYYASSRESRVNFRVTKFDNQFNDLQSEYDALDKNDEKALNEWRNKKRDVVEGYLNHIKNRFGMRSELVVFNGADEAQMQDAYNKYASATKANGYKAAEYDKFKEHSLNPRVFATHYRLGNIVILNVSTKDTHNRKARYAVNLFHENAHRVAHDLYGEVELVEIWVDVADSNHKIVERINNSPLYEKKGSSAKGSEFLAFAMSYIIDEHKPLFLKFVKDKDGVTADDVAKKLNIKRRKANFAVTEILNNIKDEYKSARNRKDSELREGVGGVGSGDNLRDSRRDVSNIQGDERGLTKGGVQRGGGRGLLDTFLDDVAKRGLRDMVGGKRFDDFLMRAFRDANEPTRRQIANEGLQNGMNFLASTDNYLASLAKQDDVDKEYLNQVKSLFTSMLNDAGVDVGEISDNELLYALWRNNLEDRSLFGNAEDVLMQQKLGVGNFRTRPMGKEKVSFRSTDKAQPAEVGTARKEYDNAVRRHIEGKNTVGKYENVGYKIKEAYQDSMLSVKKLQEAIIKEAGGKLLDSMDAYTAENQLSSKNKAEMEAYERDYANAMMEQIGALLNDGASYEEIVDYMLAKHGLERNIVFSIREAEKRGGIWDGVVTKDYAGLTELTGDEKNFTDEAQKIVDEFEQKHDTEAMWKAINAATKASLKKSYDSGMMDKETFNNVSTMFNYYIPLRGWDNNSASNHYEYIGGSNVKISPALKTAKGRKSRADDPIATILLMGQSSIVQGNRNKMKQRLLNLALAKPTSLLTVNDVWYVKQADGTWRPEYPVIPENATGDEVDAITKQFEEKMEALGANAQKSKKGLELGYHTTAWEGQEHTIRVMRNGKEYLIFVNGNPNAAQAINGFTNPNAAQGKFAGVEEFVSKWTRVYGGLLTSQNPAFMFSNLSRDLIFAGTAVAIKEDAKYATKYTKNIASILGKGKTFQLLSKWEKGKLDTNNEVERYFKEFLENGGETGFTNMQTLDDYKRNVESFLKKAKGSKMAKVKAPVENVLDFMEHLNRGVEDMTRFAVYMTSRQSGRSITQSVANAKDITVNFNKKGRGNMGAGVMNLMYLFFNATVQSLANFGGLFKNHPVKATTAATLMASAGMLVPMLMAALSDDEEQKYYDLPDWVRRNNLCLRIPATDTFITIPMPHELRPFYGLGEIFSSMLSGQMSVADGLKEAAQGFASLSPIDFLGNDGDLRVNLTPSLFQPLAQLAVNKDYFGTPIQKETPYNELDPEWTKAYKGTNATLVEVTKAINTLGSGDEVKSGGWLDWSPAKIEHIFESYLGGMGKTLNRAGKTISMLWNEDAQTWRNVPIASSFVYKADERNQNRAINEKYYEAIDEAEDTAHTVARYKKIAKNPNNLSAMEYAEKLDEFMKSPTYKRYTVINDAKKKITKAFKELDNVDKADRKAVEDFILETKLKMFEELENIEEQGNQ